jgi:hypothetical protein
MMELTRGGIIRSQAEWIDALIADRRRTMLTICSLPEEMPVVEAIELHDRALGSSHVNVGACFPNRTFSLAITARQVVVAEQLAAPGHAADAAERLGGEVAPLVESARIARRLHEESERHARRLRSRMSVPVVEIPIQVASRPGLATTRAVAAALGGAA